MSVGKIGGEFRDGAVACFTLPQRFLRLPALGDQRQADVFLLGEDDFADLSRKAGGQLGQQRRQPGIQHGDLVGGQPLNQLLCQRLLRSRQRLRLEIMEARQRCANAARRVTIQRLGEQKRDNLFR